MLTLVGTLLLIGAPAAWLAAGTPGGPTTPLGTMPGETGLDATGLDGTGLGESVLDGTTEPSGSTAPAADDGARPSATVPIERPVPDYTTTAPRGAIDRTQWPATLAIPALSVSAPVQAVGVSTDGELLVPASPMDVGWYQGGSVPGEPGVALLTSHIDTRAEGRGVLAGLVRLSEGDEAIVTAADGTPQRWSVIARTQHRKDQLPPELFARSGVPILALVTCGGPFDATARSYRDNVIVWLQPAP